MDHLYLLSQLIHLRISKVVIELMQFVIAKVMIVHNILLKNLQMDMVVQLLMLSENNASLKFQHHKVELYVIINGAIKSKLNLIVWLIRIFCQTQSDAMSKTLKYVGKSQSILRQTNYAKSNINLIIIQSSSSPAWMFM